MAFSDGFDFGDEPATPAQEKKAAEFSDNFDFGDDSPESSYAPKPAEPAQVDKERGDTSAGWAAGWEGYKSLGNLAKGAIGQMIGDDEMQAEGIADAKKNEARAAEIGKGHKTRIEDVESVGDFIDYAQYGLATLIPYALESMGASIIGGVVGGATAGPAGAGGGAIAGFIGRNAVKQMVKEYAKGSLKGVGKKKIEGMVKQDMLDYAGGRLKDKATKKMIESSYKRAAASAGAKAGAFGSGYRMGLGDVYGNSVEAGDPSPWLAAGLAVPYGILDMLPEAMGIDRILMKGSDGFIKRTGKAMLAQAPMEGLTELAQEEINIRTQAGLNPDYDPYSDEANSIRLNSLILGALGGGAFGALSGGLQRVDEEGAGGIPSEQLYQTLNGEDTPYRERIRAVYKIEAAMAVEDREAADQWKTFAMGRIQDNKPVFLTPEELKVATAEILNPETNENINGQGMPSEDGKAEVGTFFSDAAGEFGLPTKEDETDQAEVEEVEVDEFDAERARFDEERLAAKKEEEERKQGVVVNQKLKNKEEAEKKARDAKRNAEEKASDIKAANEEVAARFKGKTPAELRNEYKALRPGEKIPATKRKDLIRMIMEEEGRQAEGKMPEMTREKYFNDTKSKSSKELIPLAESAFPAYYNAKGKSHKELVDDLTNLEYPSGKPGENDHIWDSRVLDGELMVAVEGVVGSLSEANKPQNQRTYKTLDNGVEVPDSWIRTPSMNKLISELHVDDTEVFMGEQKAAIKKLQEHLAGGQKPGSRQRKIISALLDVQQEERYEGQVVEETGRQPRPPAGTETTAATMEEMDANAVPADLETGVNIPADTVITDEVDTTKLRSIKQLRSAAEAANPEEAMNAMERDVSPVEEAKALRQIIKDESERRAADRKTSSGMNGRELQVAAHKIDKGLTGKLNYQVEAGEITEEEFDAGIRGIIDNVKQKPADAIDTAGYISAEIRAAVREGRTVGTQDSKGDVTEQGMDLEAAIDNIDYLIDLNTREKLTKDRLVRNHAMRFTGIQSVAEIKEIFDKGNIGETLNEIRSDLMKRDLNGKLIEGMDEVLSPTKKEEATQENIESLPIFTGKIKGEDGYGASIGNLSKDNRRQLMVDPSGGYFWGDFKQASNLSGGANLDQITLEGEHKDFTPASFDGSKEARKASEATPQSKTEPTEVTDEAQQEEIQTEEAQTGKKGGKAIAGEGQGVALEEENVITTQTEEGATTQTGAATTQAETPAAEEGVAGKKQPGDKAREANANRPGYTRVKIDDISVDYSNTDIGGPNNYAFDFYGEKIGKTGYHSHFASVKSVDMAGGPKEYAKQYIRHHTMVKTKSGNPFKTFSAAELALKGRKMSETHEVEEVDGGFVGVLKTKKKPSPRVNPEEELASLEATLAESQAKDDAKGKAKKEKTEAVISEESKNKIATMYKGGKDGIEITGLTGKDSATIHAEVRIDGWDSTMIRVNDTSGKSKWTGGEHWRAWDIPQKEIEKAYSEFMAKQSFDADVEAIDFDVSQTFKPPKKTVNLTTKAGKPEMVSTEDAASLLAEWKAEANRQGKEEDHSDQVIISLFDASGEISKPWREAGYDVLQYDIKLGDDLMQFYPSADIQEIERTGKRVVGVIAQPPCTCFSGSGSQWWKTRHDKHDRDMVNKMFGEKAAEYFSQPLDYTKTLVALVENIIGDTNPEFFAMENPVGRIATEMGLPKPTLSFHPHNFGFPYTKKTQLWGKFNPNLPTANVEPTKGSWAHQIWSSAEVGGGERSLTPESFAYSFFMANKIDAVKEIGVNKDGEKVFEDVDGVKFVFADGVKVKQKVAMRPTRAGVETTPVAEDRFTIEGKKQEPDINKKVLYHGTDRKAFEKFMTGAAQGWGEGIYLTDNKSQVKEFGGRVIEVKVKLENPFTGNWNAIYDDIENTKAFKSRNKDSLKKYDSEFDIDGAISEDGEFVGEVLRELGFDGVVAEGSNNIEGTEVVVFDEGKVSIIDQGEKQEPKKPPKLTQRKQAIAEVEKSLQIAKDAHNTTRIDELEKRLAKLRKPKTDQSPKIKPTKKPTLKASYEANKTENTVFTDDKMKEMLARLKKGSGTLQGGLDPDLAAAGIFAAGHTIEKGLRNFAAFSKAMYEMLGNAYAPYFRGWYENERYNPDIDTAGMTPLNEMDAAAVEAQAAIDAIINVDETEVDDGGQRNEPENQEGSPETQGEPRVESEQDGDRQDDIDLEGGQPEAVPEAQGGGSTAGVRGNTPEREEQGGTNADEGGDAVHGRPPASGEGVAGSGAGSGTGGANAGGVTGGEGVGGTGSEVGGAGVETTAEEQEAQKHYHAENPLEIIGGGPVARFNKNKAAIELFYELQSSGQLPTADEKNILAAYTGFGSFGQELFDGSWETPKVKKGWEARDEWLRDHLGKSAWQSMQRSITNSHYTDPPTVMAMWDMVKRMGFTGGSVLEPGMGIGNFFAMMPIDLKDRSSLTGIELDEVTGGMAKMLYPSANISIKGYQESRTQDDFYDLVIGNWPFEDTVIPDRRYNRLSPMLHDYYFLKAIDQTRPGGLVVGITSKGTLDKVDPSIRIAMAKKAELVASFRLPSGAFKEYAGTSVVTDIIILKKRESPIGDVSNEVWTRSADMDTPAGTPVRVSNYYAENPDNVVGTIDFGHGTTTFGPGQIVRRPRDMAGQLERISNLVPEGTYQPVDRSHISHIANHTDDRQGALVDQDGTLHVVNGEHLDVANDIRKYKLKDNNAKNKRTNATRESQLRKLISLRKAYGELIEAETTDKDTDARRSDLNRIYSEFVATYGKVNKSWGLNYMRIVGDPFFPTLSALEKNLGNDQAPRWVGADILTRSTMKGKISITSPGISDSFVLARNKFTSPSLEVISEIADKPPGEVKKELIKNGSVFETEAGDIIPSDIYLSGNVRLKLRDAQSAVKEGAKHLKRNVDALQKIVPKDVPFHEIEARMGASWIPTSVYNEYVAHMLGMDGVDGINTTYVNGKWAVGLDPRHNHRPEASTNYGTRHAAFKRILNYAIANKTIVLKEKVEGVTYVLEDETEEANERIARIRDDFSEWVWKDPERRITIEHEYNDARNAWADPEYDGSFMEMEGMALQLGENEFSLRKHQVDSIWQGVVNRRSLNAHEVGTGKSFVIAGIAVESRRYGIAKKPLVLAHNANSASVASDIITMYPAAKVLYIDNLSPKTIATKLRQIANDDWDAIVMPHSLINRLTLTEATMRGIAEEEIALYEQQAREAAMEDGVELTDEMLGDDKELNKLRSITAKQLVKARNKIINNIIKLGQRASRDNAVPFEELGIDMLLVDESHEFKKPPIITQMNMKGLNKDVSDKSIGLKFLTRYTTANQNGGNVHLFTGTPITNTLTEIFHQMSYIMEDQMKAVDVDQWDGWFGSFASEVPDVELNAAAEYEDVTRLSSFINVADLRKMVGQYMSVVFSDDMPEMAPRKTVESGKTLNDPTLTEMERGELENGRTEGALDRPYKKIITQTEDMTSAQMDEFNELQARARRWRAMDGRAKKEAMNNGDPEMPILVEGDAAKASFDVRLVNGIENAGLEGKLADDENSKSSRVVRNVTEIYKSHDKATQVIFTQLGLSKKVDRSEGMPGEKVKVTYDSFATMYDIVERLVEQGIPRDEIALVTGSTTKEKRKDIARDMNSAKIRVVIGSSQTLGVGVNMQMNLRAMHHMDAPWMPGDLEQRNGRGWRQGNQWNTVLEYRYITDRLDGRRWQILAIKAKVVKDFLTAGSDVRVIEGDAVADEESDILTTFAEAAGDPRVLIKAKLKKKIKRLESRDRLHTYAVADSKQEARNLAQKVKRNLRWIEEGRELSEIVNQTLNDNAGDKFTAEISNNVIRTRKGADAAIKKIVEDEVRIGGGTTAIGTVMGHDAFLRWGEFQEAPSLFIRPTLPSTGEKTPVAGQKSSIASLTSAMRKVDKDIESWIGDVESANKSISRMNEIAKEPFKQQKELTQSKDQLANIERDMEMNPVPPPSWLRNGAPMDTEVYWTDIEKDLQKYREKIGWELLESREDPIGQLEWYENDFREHYVDKKEPLTVTGHRWTADGWFVLASDNKGEVAMPYLEVKDNQGYQIYEEREFEAPEVIDMATEEDELEGGIRRQFSTSTASKSHLTTGRVKVIARDVAIKNGIRPAKIVTVGTEKQLPKKVLDQAAIEGVLGQINAVHDNGIIYVVADKQRNQANTEEALLHEIQHLKARKVLGKAINPLFQNLYKGLGGVLGMRRAAKKLGMLDQFNENVKTARMLVDEGKMSAEDKAEYLVDEFLALVQGAKAYDTLPEKAIRAIKEFIGAVKDALRRMGFPALAELNDNDVVFLLKKINQQWNKKRGGDKKADFVTSASFMFGGRGAVRSEGNRLDLARAWVMDQAGKSQEEILDATGSFKAPDGKWRFEIDDSKAELLSLKGRKIDQGYRLGTILKHDKLFEAYPKLKKKVWVVFKNNMDIDQLGSMGKDGTMRINGDLSEEEILSTMLHEIQHAIQHKEGFAAGANAAYYEWEDYLNTHGEIEARDVQNRMGMSPSERRRKVPVLFERYKGEIIIRRGSKTDTITAPSSSIRFSRATTADDYITDFEEQNAALREEDRNAWTKARLYLKRQFAPGGNLPQTAFSNKIMRDNGMEVDEFDIRHIIGRYERAIKKQYGVTFDKLSQDAQQKLSDALHSKNIDKSIKGEVRQRAIEMRDHIDTMSKELNKTLLKRVSDISGLPQYRVVEILEQSQGDASLIASLLADSFDMQTKRNRGQFQEAVTQSMRILTIAGNMGSYVHRSYRAFDDPKWFKKLSDETIDDARQYLIGQYEKLGSDDAPAQAERVLHEMVKTNTAYDSMSAMITESKLGAKDLSILKRKNNQLHESIRNLLGEYKDPRVNFAKSSTLMSRLVWNHRFLENVLRDGVNNFLWERKNKPPGATVRISSEGNEVFSPLDGYWTFPEIDQAFHDALDKENMDQWYRTIVQANGMVKVGKTVLSPTTAMRNWQSALFFSIANGHFDLTQSSKAFSGLREYFTQQGSAEKLAYLRRLKELGVVYDTPYAGEMMRLLGDSRMEEMLIGKKGKAANAARFMMKHAQNFYSYGDDFWKIIGFENEKNMLMKHAGMSKQEAEIEAAERIRNTYPTYSMVGRGMKQLRKFPLAGTFVSFPAEIIRTSYHIMRYAAQDMKTPGMRAIAMRRMVGISMVSSMAYGLQVLSAALLGIDDDEEEAVRLLAAPWQRNSNLWFTGRDKDGDLEYFDISFLDPYNYWKRPINAILRDQPWEDMAKDIAKETMAPFLGTDITAGAIGELYANKTSSGKQIYSPHDNPVAQVLDWGNHMRKAIQPGVVANVERTFKAVKGMRSPSGRVYNLSDEATAWAGWRTSTLDPKLSLYYRSFEFTDTKKEATIKLNSVIRNPNKITDSELVSAHQLSRKLRKKAYEDFGKIVHAAQKSGLNRLQVRSILRNSGVSKRDIYNLMNGTTPNWRPSKAALRNAIRKANAIFDQDTVQEFKRRYRLVQNR